MIVSAAKAAFSRCKPIWSPVEVLLRVSRQACRLNDAPLALTAVVTDGGTAARSSRSRCVGWIEKPSCRRDLRQTDRAIPVDRGTNALRMRNRFYSETGHA